MSLRRYCLITPCRDEAAHARRTIESVLKQTALPALWVLVDDGSTDQTPEILSDYARKYPWIRVIRRADRGERKLGGGVIDAFYAGYESIRPEDFDYLCKFDLDLDLPPRYFELILDRMEANPRLGTCSGKPYFNKHRDKASSAPAGARVINRAAGFISEKCGDENSVGMIKFYRTACFKQIGGFVRMLMWDGIDGHRCRMNGWIAASYDDPEIRFEHLRPMGTSDKGFWRGRSRHGVGQYYMGTGPLYLLASALYRMTRPPLLIGGVAMIWGYLKAFATHQPRYDDPAFRQFLRKYHHACLILGKKRATQSINNRQADKWRGQDAPMLAPSTASAV